LRVVGADGNIRVREDAASMFAKEGLEGVVAARTSICLIRGEDGTLAYRGYSIDELARSASFEEVAYLLWFGELPTARQLASFDAELRANRSPPPDVLDALSGPLVRMHPMDWLRTAVSMLAADDPDVADNSEAANLRKGLRITAAMPALVAAHERIRKQAEPPHADKGLNHAQNFLWMMTGHRPSDPAARAIELAMIVQADHGLNASTFAARVTAGTLADMHAAIVAALGALKGPLHGGASGQVIEMLQEVGDASDAARYVERALAQKRKIAGFGHRVYKAADPRAPHLKAIAGPLAEATGSERLYQTACAVEDAMRARRGLSANIDFYSALVDQMVGLPTDQFASAFACARIAGWVAHVIEQHLDNRLIRPLEEYIGPLPRPFVPIADRS
jgi:citrate synthase